MLDQDLVAGPLDVPAMLLQAGEHHLVAVIHDPAAQPHDVTRAGVVLAPGGLCRRARGDQEEGNAAKKFRHMLRLRMRTRTPL